MNFSLGSFFCKRYLLYSVILLSQISVAAQDTLEISELEYFFDIDPGVGSAMSIVVTPDSLVSTVEILGSSGLSVGFHVLGFRAKNVARVDSVSFDGITRVSTSDYIHPSLRSAGQWGATETRLVYVDPSETGGIVEVDEIEYFFDIDPGVGSATIVNSFASANVISIVEIINSNTLSFGFHSLGMRVKAVGGSWGLTETRLVFIDQSDSGNAILVDSLEYFFDVDPGVGSATIIDGFSASTLFNSDEILVSNGLSFGFHSLGMRVKAVGESWGMTETRLVFVDQSESGNAVLVDSLEYFFDIDPGVGSATIIDGFAASTLINTDQVLLSNTLSLGFHSLGMRAKAVGGSWGTTETRLIFVDPSSSGGIINVDQIEYFFDVDPGVGSATLVSAFTANDLISLDEVLNTSALSAGFHVLGMRARAEGGSWGPIESKLIYVDNIGNIQSNIVQLEYFIDDDPGFGNATSIPVSVPDVSVSESASVDISGFSNGTHGIHVRALNDFGEWSLIETDTFQIVNIGGPVISSLTGDTTNATPIDIIVSFDRQVVGFDETDIAVFGNGRLQPGSLADNGDGTFNLSLDSLNEGLIEVFIYSGSANALDDNSPTPSSDTLRIIYDITAPNVTIDALATIVTSPALSGTVNDTSSTVEITLDGNTYSAFVVSDSTWTLAAGTISPSLSDGIYEVEVTATDIAGNIGLDGSTDELIVDTTAPNVIINSLITSAGSPELTGSVDEPTITLDVDIAGNVYSGTNNGDGTWTLSAGTISPSLSDGIYDVAVTATDLVGNVGTDASAGELTIDNVAPTITINSIATSIRSPELSGTVDDVTATVSIEVDGTTYSATNNGDGSWTLSAGTIGPDLTDAVYDVIATATDVAGNVGNDATTDELTITTDILAIPATAVTPTSFQANWSTGLDVKEYRVDVSDQVDFSTFLSGYEDFNANTSTSISVSSLDFKTTYYYRVRLVAQDDQVSDNSNTISVKTTVDAETIADSTALVQIYDALDGSNWSPAVNWETARLRDWNRVELNSSQTRVEDLALGNLGLAGDMPNPFTGDAVGGLSELLGVDLRDNELTGLMDFLETSITSLNVSGNNLQFDDLEPLVGITTLNYSDQASIKFNDYDPEIDSIRVRSTNDFNLSVNIGGTTNRFQWKRNGNNITTGADFSDNGSNLDILSIDYDNMGEFTVEVTSTIVLDLTINVDPQKVFAIADMTVEVRNNEGALLPERVNGFLYETTRLAKGYTLLETRRDVTSTFTFPDVVLGNYIMLVESDKTKYTPTYFGDGNIVEWNKADTVFFRDDTTIQFEMTSIPAPTIGDGTLDIVIEEDFGDGEGRIDARRRAARRKCGLRRKRTGGRTEVDEDGFELIAYGETDENGEFQFDFLPQGTYRFFVEYPGIPIDDASFVEFEVGEAGISNTDFKLEAFASPDGIEVTIDAVLGVIFDYFKNLQIYPNPSSDVLTISYRHLTTDAVKLELLDLTGAVLLQRDLQQGYDRDLTLDVSPFMAGIYLLRIYDTNSREKNVVTYRIMIHD